MRPISGVLILALGVVGSIIAYWWMGLILFFVGEALGVLSDRTLTGGLFAVGALAGGGAGLVAGVAALLSVRALVVQLPKKLPVFLGTWGAWIVLGAFVSAFLRNALSPLAAASLLGVCYLAMCGLYLLMERMRTR